jgi:hypothetical protein
MKSPQPTPYKQWAAEQYIAGLGSNQDFLWTQKHVYHIMWKLGWVWNKVDQVWVFEGYPNSRPTEHGKRIPK